MSQHSYRRVENPLPEPEEGKTIGVACSEGVNRSRWLAKHLEQEYDYKTVYGGTMTERYAQLAENPITEEMLEKVDIWIAVYPSDRKRLVEDFGVNPDSIIELTVLDEPPYPPAVTKDEYYRLADLYLKDRKSFNREWTYPQLLEQIRPYLPDRLKRG